jgi:hypothetical protein
MATEELTLTGDIVQLLRIELMDSCAIGCSDGQVTVTLSRTNCEKNYGNIVQHIHRVIDRRYPERSENVFILLRDEAGVFQNVMKIWKPG